MKGKRRELDQFPCLNPSIAAHVSSQVYTIKRDDDLLHPLRSSGNGRRNLAKHGEWLCMIALTQAQGHLDHDNKYDIREYNDRGSSFAMRNEPLHRATVLFDGQCFLTGVNLGPQRWPTAMEVGGFGLLVLFLACSVMFLLRCSSWLVLCCSCWFFQFRWL